MALAARTRLGPYEILAPLGAGGMGEVYRARDTRLGREVAIKVLQSDVSSSEEGRKRFEREARAICKLSHPNVCALFDVGREGDVDYLVMELLSGETLAARLLNGPLPFEQVLRYGAQIASALAAAHAVGVAHGDLKPANAMVTATGVKLVDFGVAKALAPKAEATRLAADSTASLALLQGSEVQGTVPYMAPEQLEGKRADATTDIFSLGAVLFEMATGLRAFSGESPAAISAAVLTTDPPPVSSTQPASSPAFDWLVRTCLAKDPEARWDSAHDVGLLLRQIAESPGAFPGDAASERRRRRWLPWAAALVAACIAAAAMLRPAPNRPPPGRPIRFSIAPPAGGSFHGSPEDPTFAVSPDGSQLVFIAVTPNAGQRLWLRRFSEAEAHPLPRTEGANSVFWSPDGRSVGFFSEDRLQRIDLPDGAPVTICHVEADSSHAGTWGKNGDILFVGGGSISRVSAAGGTASVVLRPDAAREEMVRWPWFLPDGEAFLYLVRRGGDYSLMMVAPGRAPREVMPVGSKVQFSEPGLLLFVRDGTLLAQPFDWRTGKLTGTPFAVAHGVRGFATLGTADFSTSLNGTLVWQHAEDVQRVIWLDRRGREVGSLPGSGNYLDVIVSPSGRRVAFSRKMEALGTFDVWSFDVERGLETRITSDKRNEMHPVWLPGEKAIVYSAQVWAYGPTHNPGRPHLVRRDLETGNDTDVLPLGNWQFATDISPDGRLLAYEDYLESGVVSKVLALEPGGSSVVLPFAGSSGEVRFSPDGKYIAFWSNKSGEAEVYVTPYPGPGEMTRVSSGGVEELRWARASGELFFSSPDRKFWVVPIRTKPTLHVGTPIALFTMNGKAPWKDFDVTPDGKRIVAIVPQTVSDQAPMTVLVNWPALAPD